MAAAVLAAAAVVLLAASLAAAGAPPGGLPAHAATHGGEGDGGHPAAAVIGVRWAIVDAVVAAGSDARGRDGAVVITGTTDRPGEPILVTARAPGGEVLDRIAAKASPRDGSFLAEVPTGGIGWAADGLYTVTAYQDGVAGARPAPYADIVPVAMSGGLAEPNAELSGAPVPAGAAEAGLAEPRVINLEWSMIEEVSLAPGGGAAGGDAVRLSGAAPAGGRDSVTIRVVAPTGLEMASFAADARGPLGAFEALLVTDGSAWSQDGTYRITVDGGLPGSYPDLLLVDIFDGSVAVAASAAEAASDPRGDGSTSDAAAGAAGYAGSGGALLEKRWEIIDAVAVSGQGGQGQRVVIAGSTDRPAVPVSVLVLDPQGRHASGSAVLADARTGQFVVDMPAAGDAWSSSGTYMARVEQRDALTGAVYYSDLLGLEVDGGAVAAQPRLPPSLLPPAVAAEYGDALLVALEYAVVEEVRAEAPADEGRYAEIAVYGRTYDRSGTVSVAAEAPDGSAAPPVAAEPGGDGRFEARLPVSGPFWSADGEYTITVTHEGDGRPQFVDIAVVAVRDGAVEAGSPAPAPAPAAAAEGGARPDTSPRIMNIGERWGIIDSIVLAEGPDARQSIVIAGTTDVVDRAVQATIEAPGGGAAVAAREAMPDASGAVLIEVPVGGAAWGEPRPADGTYALTVGQPGTRYLDGYPLYVLGGRISAPAEFDGAPLPLPPSAAGYESARLLDVAWSLVTRADVATAADGSPAAVVIQGETDHPKVPVSVRAEAPGGLAIYDMPVAPRADGSFEARIDASGSGWAGDGAYRITVRQGFDSVPPDLVIVEVVDGAVVPEFGTLATVALAAAIVAAVAAAAVAAPRLGLAGPLLPRA